MGRSPSATKRQQPILDALGDLVTWHSDVDQLPLELDLASPHPPRLRIYVYALIGGRGTKRSTEYKVNVRLPGTSEGEYGRFDYSRQRTPIVAGFSAADDTWVLWDASMRDQIKWAGNLQVQTETVHRAAIDGWATQARRPNGDGLCEIIIACRSSHLLDALHRRMEWAGGFEEDACPD